MNEWKTYKISELCSDIIDCVNKTAPISEVPTPYKMLRTSDIRNGFINTDNLNSVTGETFEKWTRRGKLQRGDIIFTREAPLGEAAIVRDAENYFLGQRLVLYRADPTACDNRFLLYAFLNHETKQSIIAKGNGATVLHLRVPECGNIEIKAPDIKIQKRIGNILSAYDDLIENNQKQIKLLEEAAQRLYKEWFVDLRFPGYETTPIVDGVPEGWGELYMDDICDSIGGGTPSTKNEEYYRDGQIKWVTPTDITRKSGLILLDTEKKITEEGLHNSSAKMVPPYTILMTSRASVGYFGICEFEVCTNQGFISCVPYEEEARFYLLYNLMNRVDEIRAKAGGSTFLEISKKNFRSMKILVPSACLLDMFNKMVRPIIRQMEVLTRSIAKLQEARDRLLPKLMSGEIEV